jgi:hypothetical protein
MNEFLQTYGIWIVVGLFFLLMIFGRRGHGMGGGCCGGPEQEPKKPGEKEGHQEEKQSSGCH